MNAVRGHWGVTALTAVGPATWGTTYYVTTELLPPDRPLLAAAVRALPAGLLILLVRRHLPVGVWWLRAAALGALNIGFFFPLLFLSAYRLPGGVAATLGAVQPLLVALLGAVLLAQPVRGLTLVAGVGGVAGVGLMVLRGEAALDPAGVLAGLLAAASMALGVVLTKRWGRPAGVDVLTFTGWLLASGGVLLVPLTLVVEGVPPVVTGTNVAGFAYLTLVNTALAYYLWLRGLDRLPARNVAFLALVSPVVAVLVGAVVLGERLGALQVVGVLVALGSLVLAQWPAHPRPRAVPGQRAVTGAGTGPRLSVRPVTGRREARTPARQ